VHMQMVTRQAPVSRGRLAVPQAPRDCPNDIIDLINDCTTFAPVSPALYDAPSSHNTEQKVPKGVHQLAHATLHY
jgi:hypothetical protein